MDAGVDYIEDSEGAVVDVQGAFGIEDVALRAAQDPDPGEHPGHDNHVREMVDVRPTGHRGPVVGDADHLDPAPGGVRADLAYRGETVPAGYGVDVKVRADPGSALASHSFLRPRCPRRPRPGASCASAGTLASVSYTHLTLPTIYSV